MALSIPRFVLLVTVAGLVAGRSDQPAIEQCERETGIDSQVSAAALADHVDGSALEFVQKALRYKHRNVRPDPLQKANFTQHRAVASHPTLVALQQTACDMKHYESKHFMPMTPQGRMELQAFEVLGLLPHHPPQRCTENHQPRLATMSVNLLQKAGVVTSTSSVEEENAITKNITIIWASVGGFLVLWSVVAVVMVPAKKEGSSTEKLQLADEDAAWERGMIYWVSLAWVDGLIGRYGKRMNCVIDDKELIENRKDHEYVPFVLFKKYWNEEIDRKGLANASMTIALYKTVGLKSTVCLVVAVLIEMLTQSVLMVVALDHFLRSLAALSIQKYENPGQPVSYLQPFIMIILLLWGVPMVYRVATTVTAMLDGYYTNICASGLACVVFEKAMSLPAGSDGAVEKADELNTKPNVVQLLNIDIIETWGYLLKSILYTAFSPLFMIVLLVMLVQRVRASGTVGLLYIIPCLMTIIQCQKVTQTWWVRYQGYQDKRLGWLTETMMHIRTIKSLAWEKLCVDKLVQARSLELSCQQRCVVYGGTVAAAAHTMPWGVLLMALFCELMSDGQIKATEIAVLQRLVQAFLASLATLVTGLGKMQGVPNSFKRIRTFLEKPQFPRDLVRAPAGGPDGPAVRIKGNWCFLKGRSPVLRELDISIPRGELVAVVGGVASGKSAFVQALIGELYPVDDAFVEGAIPGSGHLAYCAQVPWIFEGTLRDNILLNQPMDNERYYAAIHAAALTSDLQILPGGDQVTIGSYGIRLSGGQRARVALARAAYMLKADVLVIDDPFASVDVPTGQHICNEMLLGSITKGKTRIVVTQPNPGRLRNFDRILVIEDGRVVQNGKPSEVIESQAFQKILATGQGAVDVALEEAVSVASGAQQAAAVCAQKAIEAPNILREEEGQDHITWATMWYWLKCAGWMNLAFFVLMVFVQRMVMLKEALVIANWIDAKLTGPTDDKQYMLRALLIICCSCTSLVCTMYSASRVSFSASRVIHEAIIKSITWAPIDKFFDKQPIGRLVNRLSFDLRQVDDAIAAVLCALLLFAVGFFVQEGFVLHVFPREYVYGCIPLFGILFFFVYVYRGTAVPLVFHSKFSLSTLQDLQAVVLNSCVSIRANGMLDDFQMKYNHYSASVIRCQYLIYHVCKGWVQSRVFLCFSYMTCILAMGGIVSGMPLGTLSMVITISFGQMAEFENVSLGFTHFLNILNALERLVQFLNIPHEAAGDLPDDKRIRQRVKVERAELCALEVKKEGSKTVVCIKGGMALLESTPDGFGLKTVSGARLSDLAPKNKGLKELVENFHIVAINSVSKSAAHMAEELCCPPATLWLDLWLGSFEEGMRVQLEDLTAGYNSEKSVLLGVSVDIAPRCKIGFAGKTGCGKSTTLLCILRILEPRSGTIRVGGIDTSKMGLNALRSMIGLVPQDPTVFEGTWRFNIDPFGEFPDGRIWEALQCVQLMPYLRSLPDGIDSEIARDGANLSFGQRQLLSLARMVVRQPPVLLLDECTSALDPNTQEAAQKTLLSGFPMTTVIAIAHRVETILDFDRIVVFDKGVVAEQGPVKDVLKIPNGLFAKMVAGSCPDRLPK